jgi:hypothetical protein
MRLALDTNRYTDLCRGEPSVIEAVELADEVWLPFIVVGELRAGFAVGSQGTRNEAALGRFLLKPGVAILYADGQTTGNCAGRERRFPPTICGSPPLSCSIRWSCSPATHTSTRCRS